MSDLDLNLLKTFITVTTTGSFNRAAHELNVSQSVVSERIKKLELFAGARLMERDRKGARLTEAGELLRSESEQLLQRSGDLLKRVNALANGENAVLRVASTHWAMFDLAPRVLSILRREANDLTIELVHAATSQQVKALANHTLDVGIMRIGKDEDNLAFHSLLVEPLMVAVPSDDRLADKLVLSWADLKERRFLLTGRQFSPAYYGHLLQCCLDAGFTPDVFTRGVHFRTLLAHVAAGFGVGFVPRSDNFQHTDIALRPIEPGIDAKYVFATRLDERRNSVARLITTVQAHL